jgi:hypothetical protein
MKTPEKDGGNAFLPHQPVIRKPFLGTLAACLLSASGHAWEKPAMRRSRRDCIFVPDHKAFSVKLTNGEFDQIQRHARALEQATCPKGAHNGVLGQCALQVLEAFRKKFYNRRDGLCCPSVKQLRKVMQELGYKWSRSAIFEAFRRLELAGILGRIRRHKRAWVTIAGRLRETTVQMSSLYTFSRPHAAAHLIPRPRKVLTASERVGRLLNNLGRCVSMKEAGSKPRPGPQGNLSFPFKSGAACSGEGWFSVGRPIG